jgi:predicted GNAT family acetyltransferase
MDADVRRQAASRRSGAAVNVVRFADAAAFLARVRPWLMRAEIENNVIDSIAAYIAAGLMAPKLPPYFAAAIDGEAVAACALRTPPHKLVITDGPDPAVRALANDVFALAPDLPAVHGPEPAANVFATAWTRLAGCKMQFGTRHRLYSTRVVTRDLPRTAGHLRHAELRERPLALRWAHAFAGEAMPPNEKFDHGEAIDRAFRQEALFFWDDAGPVTMVAARGMNPTNARVGHVYTPPDKRRRGYATAAVAALTSRLLAEGKAWCCLYTDLANPTSNSIYQQVGYSAVRDFNDYVFSA